MGWTVYRLEPDGGRTVIGCVDDLADAGPVIYADRDNIDYEAAHVCVNDKGGQNERE